MQTYKHINTNNKYKKNTPLCDSCTLRYKIERIIQNYWHSNHKSHLNCKVQTNSPIHVHSVRLLGLDFSHMIDTPCQENVNTCAARNYCSLSAYNAKLILLWFVHANWILAQCSYSCPSWPTLVTNQPIGLCICSSCISLIILDMH